jgi:hypothetical protein
MITVGGFEGHLGESRDAEEQDSISLRESPVQVRFSAVSLSTTREQELCC